MTSSLRPSSRAGVALSWSGGKDCSLALAHLRADPDVEVVALLTSVTRGYDRISIHGVRRALLERQAERAGLPLHTIELEPVSSNAAYEAAFASALAGLRAARPNITGIAFGDLFLADVRAYRERLLAGSGCDALFPLWGRDTAALARDFIAQDFVAHLVCVDTAQLSRAFAGRRFDERLLADLPPHVDPCGENGEFHTFVSAGPIFSRPIVVEAGEVVLRDGRFAYCDYVGVPSPGDRPAASDLGREERSG